MTDTTISGTSNTTAGMRIDAGDRLIFNPAVSTTLTVNVNYANTASPSNNLIVEGERVMHPANASIIHKIVFAGIDETKMQGGTPPDHMNPPSTDPGIWVLMSGKLDLVGTEKTSWTNEATDPANWAVGDTLKKAAWGVNATEAEAYTMGSGVDTYTTMDGVLHYRERFNLTRNVRIEGQSGTPAGTGFGHLMFMADQPQTVKWVAFNNWGPAIFSRWSLHFHRVEEGSRGSEITGCVVNESRGHVYVHHRSYGITWTDCIAFHGRGDVFWYDSQGIGSTAGTLTEEFIKWNAPLDIMMDHCGVFSQLPRVLIVSHPSPGVSVPDPNDAAADGIGFWFEELQEDFTVTVKNCVVAGTLFGFAGSGTGTGTEKGAYNWDSDGELANSVIFFNNVAHNIQRGIAFWKNEHTPHFLGWEIPPLTDNGKAAGDIDLGVEKTGKNWVWWTHGNRPHGAQFGAYGGSYHSYGLVLDAVLESATVSTDPKTGRMHNQQQHVSFYADQLVSAGVRPVIARAPLMYINSTMNEFLIRDPMFWYDGDPAPFSTAHRNAVVAAGDEDFFDVDRTIRDQECIYNDIINCNIIGKVTPAQGGRVDEYITIENKHVDSILRVQLTNGQAFVARWGTFDHRVVRPTTKPPTWDISGNGTETWDEIASFYPYITQGTLANAAQGQAYSQQLTITPGRSFTPGTPPYTWRLGEINGITSTLPAGLTLNASTGLISGTPTTLGSSTFLVRVRDSDPTEGSFLFERQLAITVAASAVLTITTSALASAVLGTAYSQSVVATGGSTPYTWSVIAGSLPTGLSLNASTGAITGTPGTAGTFGFTIRVTDNVAATDDQVLQLIVNATAPSITIVTPALPVATVGVAYSFQMSATAGTPPYTWSLNGGQFTAGLSIASNGLISGTPTAAQTRHPHIRCTDDEAEFDENEYQLQAIVAPDPPEFVEAEPPDADEGTPYTYQFTATDGLAPYTFVVASGPLPEGLTLHPVTGVLSGTPTEGGTFPVQIGVIDANDLGSTTPQFDFFVAESTIEIVINEHMSLLDSGHRDIRLDEDVYVFDSLTMQQASNYTVTLTENIVARDDTRWPNVYTLNESLQMRDDQSWNLAFAAIHQSLPSLTQSMTAGTISAVITSTLPALTQSILALHGATASGGITSTLPALTQSMTMEMPNAAVIAQTLPALTQSIAAVGAMAVEITSTLPVLTAAMTALQVFQQGFIDSHLPALTQSMTATCIRIDELYKPFTQPDAPDNDPYAEVLV